MVLASVQEFWLRLPRWHTGVWFLRRLVFAASSPSYFLPAYELVTFLHFSDLRPAARLAPGASAYAYAQADRPNGRRVGYT